MKLGKRLLSLALCGVMLLSQLPSAAFATVSEELSSDQAANAVVGDSTCGAELTWSIEGCTLTISGEGAMYDCAGGAPWDDHESAGEVRTVVIEDGVTQFGNGAFAGLPELSKLVFMGAVPTWGTGMFSAEERHPIVLCCQQDVTDAWTAENTQAAQTAGVTYGIVINEVSSVEEDGIGWYYSDGVLFVNGVGEIYECPDDMLWWMDEIETVHIGPGVSVVGDQTFQYLPYVEEVYFRGNRPEFGTDCFEGGEKFYYAEETWNWNTPDNGAMPETYPEGVWGTYQLGNSCGINLTWSYEGHSLTISGEGYMDDWIDYSCPPWSNYQYNEDTYDSNDIYTVVLEDGVASVGDCAFSCLPNMSKIVIQGAPPAWGEDVFDDNNLDEIVFYPASQAELWDESAVDDADYAGVYECVEIDESTSGSFSDTVFWSLDGTELTISGTGEAVGWPIFYQMDEIDTIVICEGITVLGDYLFYDLPYVEKVVFEGDMPTFQEWCFYGGEVFYYPDWNETWENLEEIEKPDGEWYSYSKESQGGLDEESTITWKLEGDTLTVSGQGYMPSLNDWTEAPWSMYCDQIKHVVVEEGINSIGTYSFGGGLAMPVAVDMIMPKYAIETVSLPDSLEYIENFAFSMAENLTEINFPENLEYIGDSAFYGCAALEAVSLPASLKEISYDAFSGCSSLKNLEFDPETQDIILHSGAFSYCNALTEVELPFYSTDSYAAFACCEALETVTIPEGITVIPDAMFEHCTALQEIDFPDSLECIGGNAFYGSGLTQVVLSVGLNEIGSSAFAYCDALETVTYEPGTLLTTLNNQAFAYCENLKQADLPGSRQMGYGVFWECTSLERVSVGEGTLSLANSMFNGCTSLKEVELADSITTIGYEAFKDIPLTHLDFPESLITIKYDAFSGTGLTEAHLPEGLTTIEYRAFKGCADLTSVTIPSTATSIGYSAFQESGVTEIVLPEGLTTIGQQTFYGCAALEKITLPATLTTVGLSAFDGCTALETVVFQGTNAAWNTVKINSYNAPLTAARFCLAMGEGWYLKKDGTLIVESGVLDGSFPDDTRKSWVTAIELGDKVTDITNGALQNYWFSPRKVSISADNPNFIQQGTDCVLSGDGSRLIYALDYTDYFTLPETVTVIDPYAFADCLKNTTVTFKGAAPKLAENALANLPSGLKFRIDPHSEGWSYPTWNGVEITSYAAVDGSTMKLSADSLDGGEVTLSVATLLEVPGTIVLGYSLDGGETWVEMATKSNTSSVSYTFKPSNVGIPADVKSVRFSAKGVAQEFGQAGEVVVPVGIPVPSPVEGLYVVTKGMNLVTLAWNMIPQADNDQFSHFKVERKTGDGSYSTVSTIYPDSKGNLTCGLNDTAVKAATTYSYRITSWFSNGYAGESAEIEVTTDADTVNPQITSLTPKSDRYNESFKVTANAKDNNSLSSIVLSYSVDGGQTWTAFLEQEVSGTSASASAWLGILELPDGEVRVKAVAVDLAGNISAEYAVGYVLDRTAPGVPRMNEVKDGTTTQLSLTWSVPEDDDVSYFCLYRSMDGVEWTKVATTSSDGCTNSGLTADTLYYYRVSAVDTTGNEGECSEMISARTHADTVQPQVNITPDSGYTFGPKQTIRANAADETKLKSIMIYYRLEGTEEWQILAQKESSGTKDSLLSNLSGLESGTYQLYSSAVDSAGNVSEPSEIVTYTLDCDAPVITAVSAQAGVEQVSVAWESLNEEDLSGFHVYRNGSMIASVSNKDKTSYTYTDDLAWNQCGKAYTYSVAAIDLYGNRSECEAEEAVTPTATPDTTAPEVVLNMVDTTFAGDSNLFTATGSWDERGIASYQWDLGDETEVTGSSVNHVYTGGGTYTVTLTVTDNAGNKATKSGTITVIADDEYTQPKVTVLGYETDNPDATTPLSGAQVVFDLGNTNISYYTDGKGVVQFRRLEEGVFTIGAYKDGYLPVSANVTLIHGQPAEVTLLLEKKPIVTGTLTTRELTYDEIVALDIDLDDPSNQNVYHFSASINIGGNISHYDYYYNSDGESLGGSEGVKTTRVGDRTYTIKPGVKKAVRKNTDGNGTSSGQQEEVNIPYVTVLDIPGTVSVLKQFYEAELTIFNQAGEEFAFDDSRATLNIPRGLTLVPTETTANSATVVMTQAGQDSGVIYGQGTASAKWILRGDEPGEYKLSADFRAVLRDFDADITATFEAEDSIVVRDPSDIHLDMIVSNTMLDRTFYVDLELYCESGTLNLPKIQFGDYTPDMISVQGVDGVKRELSGGLTELFEGEKLIYSYEITVDSDVNLLFQSNILRGEIMADEMTVNSYTRNITKFDLFSGSFGDTELGVFIRTLPSLGAKDAGDFWRFIQNTSGPVDTSDMCYRILAGDLDGYGGTIEELRMEILAMFEIVRARLNQFVDDNNYMVGFLVNEITASLWEELGFESDDVNEDVKNIVRGDIVDKIKEWFCDLDDISTDAWRTIQGVTIGVESVSSTYETIENLIKGMKYAVESIGLVFGSEYAGRYAYFNCYLNNRLNYETPSDLVFQAMLSGQLAILTEKYWPGGVLNMTSWITGADSWTNHTDSIELWAETLYQLEVVALYYDNEGTEDQRQQMVNSITLEPDALDLKVGKTASLTAQVRPASALNCTVTWSSSNSGVARVDEKGTVTAVAPGNATITAVANDGSGVSGSCEVTVTKAAAIPVPAKPYKVANTVSGVHVYWKAVAGAQKYGLWRSETGKNGTYIWIANPTDVHFTDLASKASKAVESGKTYYYKVTAMVNGTHSTMSEAIGITYVDTPDITLRVNRAAGIGLGWDKIKGASGYAIYRKSYYGNDAWARVATITDPSVLKWDDTSVQNENGTVYKYTIRALAGSDLKTLSGCRNAGRTMVRLTSRSLTSAIKTGKTSITCKWNVTAQATGYEVRFMSDDQVVRTVTIGDYTKGAKQFTGLEAGKEYKIQVRSYKKINDVGSFYSAWSAAKYVKL